MPHTSFLRNHGKTSRTPRRPFEKERLDNEMKLIGEFGLKNKREVWRTQLTLARIRKAARVLLTLDEKDPRRIFEGGALLRCAAATKSRSPHECPAPMQQSKPHGRCRSFRYAGGPTGAARQHAGRRKGHSLVVQRVWRRRQWRLPPRHGLLRLTAGCCPLPLSSGGCFALACSTRASSSWITCLR